MQPIFTNQLVSPIVQAHFDDQTITILSIETEPLTSGRGERLGLYRVSGTARLQKSVRHWSVIVKILSPTTSGRDMRAWNYWRREAHLYESDLLATLPSSLTTPRCYGVADRADGSCWIWLEDLGPTGQEWQTEQYWHAAHRLGEFNGHYLTGNPLPSDPWLNRDFLPQWLNRAPGMTQLDQALTHPLVRRLCPDDVLVGYHRLWKARYDLLTRLARLPQTFCHLDAFSANLLPRATATGTAVGTKEFVAIDWAYAGIDAVGAELAALVFARVTLLARVDLTIVQNQAAAAFDGYLAGLTAAGWQPTPQEVRLVWLFGHGLTALWGWHGAGKQQYSDRSTHSRMGRASLWLPD